MRVRVYSNLALLALALAIVVAPHLHALDGCDDDFPATSISDVSQQPEWSSASAGDQNHELPDGACCMLALAVNTLGYLNSAAALLVSPESATRETPVIGFAHAMIGDSLEVSRFQTEHSPPQAIRVFVMLHSFLI